MALAGRHVVRRRGGQHGSNRAVLREPEVRVTGPCSIWPGGCLSACVRRSICRFQNAFLEQVLPGFKWLSWLTFALGLMENFLYGVYAGLAYVPVYNFLRRRWGD